MLESSRSRCLLRICDGLRVEMSFTREKLVDASEGYSGA